VTPSPEAGLHRDVRRLQLIQEAKNRGASWAVIGATLGMTGREAKRHAHQLATRARRARLPA
jgi:hypothetical protein